MATSDHSYVSSSTSLHSNTTSTSFSSPSPSPSLPNQTHGYPRVSSRKVAKKQRKSRSAKGSNTTFINADPSSFRQMVQQLTSYNSLYHNNHTLRAARILQPDPYRPGNRLSAVGNVIGSGSMECLPTLDTSAFLLERQHAEDQRQTAEPVGHGSVDLVGLTCEDLEVLGMGMGSFLSSDSFTGIPFGPTF